MAAIMAPAESWNQRRGEILVSDAESTKVDGITSRKKDEVCEVYMLGLCKWGVKCHRQHILPEGARPPRFRSGEYCRDFERGSCPRGYNCVHIHNVGRRDAALQRRSTFASESFRVQPEPTAPVPHVNAAFAPSPEQHTSINAYPLEQGNTIPSQLTPPVSLPVEGRLPVVIPNETLSERSLHAVNEPRPAMMIPQEIKAIPAPVVAQGRELCMQYQRMGCCRRGERCPYAHPLWGASGSVAAVASSSQHAPSQWAHILPATSAPFSHEGSRLTPHAALIATASLTAPTPLFQASPPGSSSTPHAASTTAAFPLLKDAQATRAMPTPAHFPPNLQDAPSSKAMSAPPDLPAPSPSLGPAARSTKSAPASAEIIYTSAAVAEPKAATPSAALAIVQAESSPRKTETPPSEPSSKATANAKMPSPAPGNASGATGSNGASASSSLKVTSGPPTVPSSGASPASKKSPANVTPANSSSSAASKAVSSSGASPSKKAAISKTASADPSPSSAKDAQSRLAPSKDAPSSSRKALSDVPLSAPEASSSKDASSSKATSSSAPKAVPPKDAPLSVRKLVPSKDAPSSAPKAALSSSAKSAPSDDAPSPVPKAVLPKGAPSSTRRGTLLKNAPSSAPETSPSKESPPNDAPLPAPKALPSKSAPSPAPKTVSSKNATLVSAKAVSSKAASSSAPEASPSKDAPSSVPPKAVPSKDAPSSFSKAAPSKEASSASSKDAPLSPAKTASLKEAPSSKPVAARSKNAPPSAPKAAPSKNATSLEPKAAPSKDAPSSVPKAAPLNDLRSPASKDPPSSSSKVAPTKDALSSAAPASPSADLPYTSKQKQKAASRRAKLKSPSPSTDAASPLPIAPPSTLSNATTPTPPAASPKIVDGAAKPKEVCRDFRKRKCKRGKDCPYVHLPQESTGAQLAVPVAVKQEGTSASSDAQTLRAKVSPQKAGPSKATQDDVSALKSQGEHMMEHIEPGQEQDGFERSLYGAKQRRGRGGKQKMQQKSSMSELSASVKTDNTARPPPVEPFTVDEGVSREVTTANAIAVRIGPSRPTEQSISRPADVTPTSIGSTNTQRLEDPAPKDETPQLSEVEGSLSDSTFYTVLSSEGSLCSSTSSVTELSPPRPKQMCLDWAYRVCNRMFCKYAHEDTGYVMPRGPVRPVQDHHRQARPAQDHHLDRLMDKLTNSQRSIPTAPEDNTHPRAASSGASLQDNQAPIPLVPPGLGLEALIANKSARRPPEDVFTITVLDATKVTYGPGFEIRQLLTGFDSRQIILGQVPATVTPAAITAALQAFGEVLSVRLPERGQGIAVMNVRVSFASPKEAEHAAFSLDGAELFGTIVSARPDAFRSSVGKGVLYDRDVLLEFATPHRTGYVGYSTREQTDRVLALANGLEMRGSWVKAVFHDTLPKIGAFNVRFLGLPPDAKASDLDQFGENEGVMMNSPNYHSLSQAINSVIDLLQGFGDLINVNVLPPPYKRGFVRVWAHFSHSGVAENFCQALHGSRQHFIGKGKLFAKHYRTLSFLLPGNIYDVLSSEIRLLRSYTWEQDDGSTISVFDKRVTQGRTAPVQVKLVSTDFSSLTRLKTAFEKLLRGDKIVQDGEIVWDGFFSRRGGIQYFEELERIHRGIIINRDPRRRTLSLFGDASKRTVVRRAILARFAALRAQRRHIIPLSGRLIGLFFGTDLAKLRAQLGAENVDLDTQMRVLLVRGDEQALKVAQLAVDHARQRHAEERPRCEVECPVCFDEVTDPVTLKCDHTWCRSCLENYLLAAVENKHFPLTCLGDEAKCSQPIPLSIAQELLSPNDFDALIHASFLEHVQSRPKEFYYCPTPDCPQVYRKAPRNTPLQCPSCLVRICGNCHVQYHEGVPCPDIDREAEKQFEEWKKGRDVKHCPSCTVPIEREAGCNHMTCARCKTHICWVCLSTFVISDDVYSHMRRIHGGIGL